MSDLNNSLKNEKRNPAVPTSNLTQTDGHSKEQPMPSAEEAGAKLRQEKSYMNVSKTIHDDEQKRRNKPLVVFGAFCMAIFLGAMTFSLIISPGNAPNTSSAAKEALKNKVSTTLALGTVLLSEDENIGEQDYTLTHAQTGQNDTRIWIWDYAAEDGDYVQVLVNGIPHSAPFMIKHKPVLFNLSIDGLVGQVQIKGVRDGGGGITYAVRYELNNTTYFNSAPEGEFNTYTLENTANLP